MLVIWLYRITETTGSRSKKEEKASNQKGEMNVIVIIIGGIAVTYSMLWSMTMIVVVSAGIWMLFRELIHE